MELGLTDEQRELAESVHGLLAKRSGGAAVREAAERERGYDQSLWSTLCDQIGIAALPIPENHGGFGAGMGTTQVVLEELGRFLTPSPMLGSVVFAGQAVLASGDEDACTRLLPGLADGSRIAALAWTGEAGGWTPTEPACTAVGTAIHGTAHYVLDGQHADVLLVPARTDRGVALFEVDPTGPGVDRERVPAMDVTRSLARVDLDGATGRRIGTGDYTAGLAHVRDVGAAALAAGSVGAAAAALDMTVEYTKQRTQFGRAIGGFQALKHRMADAFVLVESARSAARAAAVSADSGSPEFPADAATAKVHCTEALHSVAAEMIQLHGGVAITWEHDAHLYLKRANADLALLGPSQAHLTRVAP